MLPLRRGRHSSKGAPYLPPHPLRRPLPLPGGSCPTTEAENHLEKVTHRACARFRQVLIRKRRLGPETRRQSKETMKGTTIYSAHMKVKRAAPEQSLDVTSDVPAHNICWIIICLLFRMSVCDLYEMQTGGYRVSHGILPAVPEIVVRYSRRVHCQPSSP